MVIYLTTCLQTAHFRAVCQVKVHWLAGIINALCFFLGGQSPGTLSLYDIAVSARRVKTVPKEYNQKTHPEDFLIHLTSCYGGWVVVGLESQQSLVGHSLKFAVSDSDLKAAFVPKACVYFFNNIRHSVKISPSVFKGWSLSKRNNFFFWDSFLRE